MSGAARIPATVASALSETAFQAQVIHYARMTGWQVAHFHDSRRQVRPGVHVGDKDAAGFPDLVLARPPALMFVELKAEKGRLTDLQREWLQTLERCELDVRVWRPSDWPEIEKTLSLTNHNTKG